MGVRSQRLTNWLATCPKPVFVAYAIAAAFSTCFCMYAFRKPFVAARFDGQQFRGSEIALKTVFSHNVDRLAFFRVFTYVVSLGRISILAVSSVYFNRNHQQSPKAEMDSDDPVDFVILLFKQKGDATYRHRAAAL